MINRICGIVGKNLSPEIQSAFEKMSRSLIGTEALHSSMYHTEKALFCGSLGEEISGDESSERTTLLVAADANIYNIDSLPSAMDTADPGRGEGLDSRALKKLYLEGNIRLLHRLHGDFSIAIWDQKKNALFLARDRFGIKPLFYAWSGRLGDPLLFCSNLRALVKSGLVTRELDYEAIYHYLFLTFLPQPYTPIRMIRSVRPGHYIVFDPNKGSLKETEYWDIPCTDHKPPMDENDIIEECGRLVDQAVRLRCQGESGSTAVSLSSGIDSCAVAGFVNKHSGDLTTYTFGFESEYDHLNEFRLARIVAERIHSRHFEMVITADQMLDGIPKVVEIMDTPIVGMFMPYFFSKAASAQGISTAFRGDGGNSGFQYLIDNDLLLLEKVFRVLDVLPLEMRIGIYETLNSLAFNVGKSKMTPGKKLRGFLKFLSSYFAIKDGTAHIDRMFDREERRHFFQTQTWLESGNFRDTNRLVLSYYDGKTKDFYERFNYGDYRVYYDQGLAHLGPVFASFGIDLRLPLFDHKLVEFIQSRVPSQLREKHGIDKYVLKKISGNMLPREIVKKRARGFYMPINEWLQGPLKPLINDAFSDVSLGKRDFLNKKQAKKVYNGYYQSNGGQKSWRKLMVFFILELWLRSHYDI